MPSREFELPRIYPLTDRSISGLSNETQIQAFINGGARFIQVRDKSATSRELFDSVRICLEAATKYGAKLIVNDRADIAKLLTADGVHLGQDDLPPIEARKLLGDDAIIGISTHTIEQVREATKLPLDYIAFGPIFETATKSNHDSIVGLDKLKRVRDETGDFPLVAIGGIDLQNLSSVFEAGANSVAIISAFLTDPKKIAEKVKGAIEIGDSVR